MRCQCIVWSGSWVLFVLLCVHTVESLYYPHAALVILITGAGKKTGKEKTCAPRAALRRAKRCYMKLFFKFQKCFFYYILYTSPPCHLYMSISAFPQQGHRPHLLALAWAAFGA